MREIPLTKGYVSVVDDEDYTFISQWRWCARVSVGKVYAMRAVTASGQKTEYIYMHRQINGTPRDMQTDHIDGDGLNNRRANLRTATNAQNSWNGKAHKDAASRFRGVSPNLKPGKKHPKLWVAHICINGQVEHLGTFASEDEAASAYDARARSLYGEFARTNEDFVT